MRKCFVGELTHAPLLVFSDDWGRHPSSCQHLIRRLLDSYSVYWVNTIGTRTPRLNLATLRRGFEKLRNWTRRVRATEALPDNLHVLHPLMWPWFTSSLDRRINRRLLGRALIPLLRSLPAPPIAITTLPIVADLMDLLPVQRWVYYCVDDFGEWPGLDGDALRCMEEGVVRRADMLIAVSETLQDHLAAMGRPSQLLTHGVDLEFWSKPTVVDGPMTQLTGLERPLIVFWGVVDRRMDVAFVQRLATELTGGTIVLAGPEADPDLALFSCPRVVRLGMVPFTQLPGLARDAAVLIMPYADMPATRAMQPLKLKEYLATGKPVVVRDLPATGEWADCMDVVDTPEKFARAVRLRLNTGLPQAQQSARTRLSGEGWADKSLAFERWVLTTESARDAVHSS
jgi:glycosyltransferase involved in cell wall biosynthesis